jgi:hypothetical protein
MCFSAVLGTAENSERTRGIRIVAACPCNGFAVLAIKIGVHDPKFVLTMTGEWKSVAMSA